MLATCLYAFGTGPIEFCGYIITRVLINVVADVVFKENVKKRRVSISRITFGLVKEKEDVA